MDVVSIAKMTLSKRFSPNILSAFSAVVMIAVWIAFAPTQVGGMASYIIVIGKSMEPKFHKDDLVIIHREPIYQVGDAIVYRNLELQNFVFHRIVSQQSGHYALKGDNNSWVDTYQPSHEEVIGKLWLYIPQGGVVIQKIRNPYVMMVIAGVLGAFLANSMFKKKPKDKKPMNNKSMREWFAAIKQKTRSWLIKTNLPEPQGALNVGQGEILEGSFFVLGLAAFASLILGIISFSRPTYRIAQSDLGYEHLGIFSYSAPTSQGVYDADTIKSGDPIFTKLTCSVNINFQYTLVAGQAENIAGTYQLTGMISEPISGWQRILPLQEEASFTGTTFGTTARLDLCRINELIQSMEQETDFHPGSYTLLIIPNVKLNGEISNRVLETTFNSALTFQYDHVQFHLVQNEGQGNPWTFTETGILHDEHKEANTWLFLGREIPIPTLRLVALCGLIASLGGIALLGWRVQSLSQLNPGKFFHIKYASIMIDVQNVDSVLSSSIVNVASIDALAKLAERFSVMILHTEQGNQHTYYVQANGTTYQFRIAIDKTESTRSENEAIVQEGEA